MTNYFIHLKHLIKSTCILIWSTKTIQVNQFPIRMELEMNPYDE